tara:strand:+ start:336 stop:779 length:444 start_codon:yes stop_codon:yes gene_type:complete
MDQGLGFDGAGRESTGSVRGSVHTNRFTGYMNDGRLVNKGRGPTVGNHGCENTARPGASTSVTKDPYQCPPVSAVPKLPAQGSVRDNINRGSQVRGSGMTQVKKPSNADSIRVGQGGGTNYGAVTKGKRPATAVGQTNFNYGPKSQY